MKYVASLYRRHQEREKGEGVSVHTITKFYSVLLFGILIIRTSPTSPCSAHHYYHHLHHQHVEKNNQRYTHVKTASGTSIFKRFDINETCLYIIGYCT